MLQYPQDLTRVSTPEGFRSEMVARLRVAAGYLHENPHDRQEDWWDGAAGQLDPEVFKLTPAQLTKLEQVKTLLAELTDELANQSQ